MAIPWMVVVSRTVDDDTMIDVTSGISGSISYINDFRCRIVDINVFDIIDERLDERDRFRCPDVFVR